MDSARAKRLEEDLRGKRVGDWTIGPLIDYGKSAAVFSGELDGQSAAVKLFDPELIERHGFEVQSERVARELSLRGHKHPNLIQILGGGHDPGSGFFYVVMERKFEKTLAKLRAVIPRERIGPLIRQLASVVKFLEQNKLCHRDIKPDNIVISNDFETLTLLDLGVLKPVGGRILTDSEGKGAFIGTLQYTSPEYLLREEDDSPEGWRALSFYQIGATLYEMIEGRPLFGEYCPPHAPYAMLVNAVQQVVPRIDALDVPKWRALANDCLLKDPMHRLRFVVWARFEMDDDFLPTIAGARERILRYRITRQGGAVTALAVQTQSTEDAKRSIISQLISLIRQTCIGTNVFPPLEVHDSHPESCDLCACFQPSETLSLGAGLSFVIRVDVIDPVSNAVRIDVAVAVSQNAPVGQPPATWNTLFQGVFELSQIKASLDRAIYTGFAQAIEMSDSVVTSAIPNASAASSVVWLTMNLGADTGANRE